MEPIKADLLDKRKKSHILFLILQTTSFITGSIVMSMAVQNFFGIKLEVIGPIHFIVIAVLNITVYNLVSNFFSPRNKLAFATLLIATQITMFIDIALSIKVGVVSSLYVTAQLLVFLSIIIPLVIMIKDIFLHKHDTVYSLLGAVNIYMAIGILFTPIYTLMEHFIPGVMGLEFLNKGEVFFTCYSYSWYVVTGLENPISDVVNVTIRNISILEAVISNLFIVFVVGRLMSK